MKKFIAKLLMASLGVYCISSGATASEKGPVKKKPNIVIILADDIGYTDVGCYGATKVKTPNIDRIAREGIRFTDAHSTSAVCSPSRYSLLTGQYPFRNPAYTKRPNNPLKPLGIGLNQPTIGTLAKSQGYATGVFGKWHVGLGLTAGSDFNKELKGVPLDVGFDEGFTDTGNLGSGIYIENRRVVNADPSDPFWWGEPNKHGNPVLKGGVKARIAKKPDCSRIFTEKAVAFVEKHKYSPFLLYFAPNNVHVPIISAERFKGKSECGPYGDYIMELDWMVGEVLAALDRNGLTGNTLVLFSSDNGGGYYKPANAEAYSRGHRINGNLLGQKTDIWEGGHRVPFIVRWPGKIKPGTQSDDLVSLVDLMGTFAEIWKLPLPDDGGSDSFSFLHSLTGKTPATTRRKALVYQGYYEALLAIRHGSWVLIPAQGSDGASIHNYQYMAHGFTDHGMMSFAELGFVNSDYTSEGVLKPGAPPGQLYDLSSDPSQTTNIYLKYPEKVKELTALLEKIKKEPRSRP